MNAQQNKGEIVIYQTEDGQTSLLSSVHRKKMGLLHINHSLILEKEKGIL